ncbi:hypothetical protein CBW21_05995 [Chromobacterium violaceum]|uniref:Uncharacterized protein n=1 Tax=Chromobacterium violaceum TaxID=536 RepID=A0A202BCZ7_CHRVL|nr:hypothetical protein CBW21_05995 [Chromobacterium violaceum]
MSDITTTVPVMCGKCGAELPFDQDHVDGDQQMIVCASCGHEVGRLKDVLEAAKEQILADMRKSFSNIFK